MNEEIAKILNRCLSIQTQALEIQAAFEDPDAITPPRGKLVDLVGLLKCADDYLFSLTQGTDDESIEKLLLGKEYTEVVGYNPFEDDPALTVEEVREMLDEVKKEAAVVEEIEEKRSLMFKSYDRVPPSRAALLLNIDISMFANDTVTVVICRMTLWYYEIDPDGNCSATAGREGIADASEEEAIQFLRKNFFL